MIDNRRQAGQGPSTTYPTELDRRATETYPVVQRTGIRFFRRYRRFWSDGFRGVGERAYFARDVLRGLGELDMWGTELLRQMRTIGVDSLVLTLIVSGFLGAVTAFQAYYQLFPGVQLSVLGLLVRGSIMMELGPLLTALVLTGRVGARMTAEIGTMRVTEQIDALETLAYDPVAFLAVPRFLASIVMFPALTIVSITTSIVLAWITLLATTPVTTADYVAGLRLGFVAFQVVYGLIKAVCYGAAISFVCSYEGYVTGAGAEGVGRSTAKAVVIASVAVLVMDSIVAAMFSKFLQA